MAGSSKFLKLQDGSCSDLDPILNFKNDLDHCLDTQKNPDYPISYYYSCVHFYGMIEKKALYVKKDGSQFHIFRPNPM